MATGCPSTARTAPPARACLAADPGLLLPRYHAQDLAPRPRSRSGSPPTTTTTCGSARRGAQGQRRERPPLHRCRPARSTGPGGSPLRRRLQAAWKDAGGKYHPQKVAAGHQHLAVSTSAKVVKVRVPSRATASTGKRRPGQAGQRRTDREQGPLEDYVRSVVPSEMPTSWAAEAVRAQAVAARSYAVRLRDFTSYPATTSATPPPARSTGPGGHPERRQAGGPRDVRRERRGQGDQPARSSPTRARWR